MLWRKRWPPLAYSDFDAHVVCAQKSVRRRAASATVPLRLWWEDMTAAGNEIAIGTDRPLRVPDLPDDVPEGLRRAVERFVEIKYIEDTFLNAAGHPLRELLRARDLDPFRNPWELVLDCFPFAEPAFTPHMNERAFVAAVPTRQTLGCSWKWRPKDIAEAERPQLIETLQTHPATISTAEYIWLRPLGLFAPHEGKNRVDFLRECGISTIPARVFARDYPAAERIKIYKVSLGGREERWAVLDDQWVQREPTLMLRALPVLEAYGVSAYTEPWPHGYPAPLEVCEALERKAQNARDRPQGRYPVVDLREVMLERKRADAETFCSLDELEDVHLRPRFWWFTSGIVFGGIVAEAVLPQHWAVLRELGAACCGIGFGCLGFVLSRVLRTRQRMLVPRAHRALRRQPRAHE